MKTIKSILEKAATGEMVIFSPEFVGMSDPDPFDAGDDDRKFAVFVTKPKELGPNIEWLGGLSLALMIEITVDTGRKVAVYKKDNSLWISDIMLVADPEDAYMQAYRRGTRLLFDLEQEMFIGCVNPQTSGTEYQKKAYKEQCASEFAQRRKNR